LSHRVFVIAEAGVNHNGQLDIALTLVDKAMEAGADAIKFQTFTAKELVTKQAEKADYQKTNSNSGESQFQMLKKLELSVGEQKKIFEHCSSKGIQFLSTPFDNKSLKFLSEELGLETLKIPSGELVNGPFLLDFARTNKNIILSTGMSSLEDIEIALGVIAFGLMGRENPSIEAFKESFESSDGKELLNKKVSLLHCTSEYPAPKKNINLKSMLTIKEKFSLRTGYSDHSEGNIVAISAAALGAEIIEKHFTLDKSFEGPDHKASLDSIELKEMISSIREVEKILGDGIKKPTETELKNRLTSYKSIIASKDIALGEEFTQDNLSLKRPGTGISPMKYWRLLGKKSKKSYKAEDLIK